jgi:hypothetical protein
LKEGDGGGERRRRKSEFRYLIFGQNLRNFFTKSCKVYQTILNSIFKVPNLFFSQKNIFFKKKKAWEICQNRSFETLTSIMERLQSQEEAYI